jgi:GTP-binding protein Era
MTKRATVEPRPRRAFRCGHVAIVGRPNVGKSTLVNAIVGARISITSKKPQTTRSRLLGIATSDEAQIILVDTPGFQTAHRSRLNERMNRAVRDGLAGVDTIVVVMEAGKVDAGDREVLALLPMGTPAIAALNKIDKLRDKARLLPNMAEIASLHDFAAIVPISAEKGSQLDALLVEITRLLPEGDPLYAQDDLTDRDERFLAAEFIREKIFRALGDEIPYATMVAIDSFGTERALRRIHASVYVDKASQRAILLGEGGARMKAIGSAARRDMERLFGGKVFLEIWVRVKSGWADDERMLNRIGY